MNGSAFLIAWSLLMSPEGVEEKLDGRYLVEVLDSLQIICVEQEILDQREVRYVFQREGDFQNDLDMVRRRYKDLKDAPKLVDCYRFPSRGIVNDLLTFNRAYNRYLSNQVTCSVIDCETRLLLNIQKENQELFKIWDAVRDARCEYYYITIRRQALSNLKKMLGDEDYYAGNLPESIPLGRFKDETR